MEEKIFFEWKEEDFQRHPDLACITFKSKDDIPEGCPIKKEYRKGEPSPDLVLKSNLAAFPGDQHVTEFVYED